MGYYNQQRRIIARVRAVEPPGADEGEKWKFIGDKIPSWGSPNTKTGKSGKKFPENEDHKVMYVKYADEGFNQKQFLITVPSHFFDNDGKFQASPLYNKEEILYVEYTGDGTTGTSVGWIDLNSNERGAGGGGATGPTEIGCAKWS